MLITDLQSVIAWIIENEKAFYVSHMASNSQFNACPLDLPGSLQSIWKNSLTVRALVRRGTEARHEGFSVPSKPTHQEQSLLGRFASSAPSGSGLIHPLNFGLWPTSIGKLIIIYRNQWCVIEGPWGISSILPKALGPRPES